MQKSKSYIIHKMVQILFLPQVEDSLGSNLTLIYGDVLFLQKMALVMILFSSLIVSFLEHEPCPLSHITEDRVNI